MMSGNMWTFGEQKFSNQDFPYKETGKDGDTCTVFEKIYFFLTCS